MKNNLTTYLCEKPTQASDLANYLGFQKSHRKKNHYLDERRGIAIIHAVGHIFELADVKHYVPELEKNWDINKLPVLPDEYEVVLKPEFKPIFDTCKRILSKTSLVIIATDADNEGELIAREILEFTGFVGDVKRALYTSTDKPALDKAFSQLRDGADTEFMAEEARLRRKLDWMIGINLTMAFTTSLKKKGELKKGSFSVGRVITSLGLIVNDIENQIKAFKPKSYYRVVATCKGNSGRDFEAQLLIPEQFLDKESGRCFNRKIAETFAGQLVGKKLTVSQVSSEKKQVTPPLPYDLASLQIAMGKFGVEPDETLALLQGLYDRPLSSVTYPRTDCKYLPEGMLADTNKIISRLNDIKEVKNLKLDLGKKPKSFNNKKVKIHHGIIPTAKSVNLRKLSEKQTLVYLAIVFRFCQQFMSPYTYLSQNIELSLGAVSLHSKGRKIIDMGWKVAELNAAKKIKEEESILDVSKGEVVEIVTVQVVQDKTKPPSRLTPSGLIEAMEVPGKFVSDPVVKAALKDTDGIGTSATRADIIKRAFLKNILVRAGKTVKPARLFVKHSSKLSKMNPGFTALMQRNYKLVVSGKMSEIELTKENENFVRYMVEGFK